MKQRLRLLLGIPLFLASFSGVAQTYEFENGTLTNNADIQGCDSCSGSIVGNLGGTGTVSVNVTMANAGWYKMQLYYCTGDPRTIHVTPGSGTTLSIPCDPSGGWSTAALKTVNIYLNSGTTALLFDNPSSWAPNLDRFILTPYQTPQPQTITFGTNNSVVYDLANKTYDIYFDGTKTVSRAIAYGYSDQYYESTSYATAAYSSESFTDNIGSGTKHIITLSGNNTLGMQQVFYAYSGKEYLTLQVVLTGSGSNSYRMSPLTSYEVTPGIGSGDNRAVFVPYDNDAWVRYNAYPLASAEFTGSEVTNIYNNTNRNGLVIGSLEHEKWKTGIKVSGGSASSAYVSVIAGWVHQSLTRDTRGHGWVNVGASSCPSPKIMIAADTDWRTGFEAYGQATALIHPKYVFDWTDAKPMGWNSWGAMQTNINLQKVKNVADFFHDDCAAFRTEDNTLYLDLDSYWDNMNDTQLAEFVTYCESKGFVAGIYWAPFVDWGKWDRAVEGSTYNYSQCWTMVNGQPFELDGAYAMDPTHPGTKARIDYFVNRFKTAGFKMVKLDFLSHAGIEADAFYHNSLHTGMEAFHEGMEYLIDELDGEMLTYAAISPNLATGPYFHMRRIACDAYKNIGETDYTLNSTTYGWWQNQIYDYIDADHVVFGDVSAGQNRARYASSIVTGTITTGDDFSATGPWVARAQDLLQNTDVLDAIHADLHFVPVDGNTDYFASKYFTAVDGATTYLAAFNYGENAVTTSVDMERIGLSGSNSYIVEELFQGGQETAMGAVDIDLPAADAAIYKIYAEPVMGVNSSALAKPSAYVFPNPLNADYFNIKFEAPVSGDVTLTLYDVSGKAVWTDTVTAEGLYYRNVPAKNLAKGFYMLTANLPGNKKQNFKFIKQ